MSWGAVAGAAVGVVGSALSDKGGGSGGGAGSQTQSKEPWAAAQPWIMNNLMQGQALQNAYTAQPFSNAQNQAYNNQGNQSAYMRALVPDLLGQISGQQVGFDRSKQNVRPNAFNFAGNDNIKGLLANMASGANNASPMQNTPQVAQNTDNGSFVNQNGVVSGMNYTGQGGPQGLMGSGSYGTFKYGMEMPKPGTQEYRDMSAYFANGGSDPNNYYGRATTNPYVDPNANPNAWMFTSGLMGGAPGEAEGPSSGAPGGAASAGAAGTF